LDRNSEDLGLGPRAVRSPDCPDPIVWYEVASGEADPESTARYVHHATGCGLCGVLLKEAVYDLTEETTAAERKQITELESARPGWQRRLARRIAGTTSADGGFVPWWSRWRLPRLALVAAGLAVVAIAAQRFQLQIAEKLLARAYSDERPLELRMAGARHAEFKVERGAKESLMDRPASLIVAEALLSVQMGSHSSDSRWLHAKARADLLDGKYEAARESLTRALQLSPKSPDILIDLATAYSQKGDYAQAFEYLSQVLALRPDDPVALFNRAIVGEQLHLYRQSLDDAERYLQIEPRSDWASEASKRVNDIRSKLKKHDQSHATPLLSPAQLATSAANPNLRAEVDQRIEEYLNDAVVSWLPRAYPEKSSQADPAARQALFFLADLTSQQHTDRWLSDLLRGSSSVNFPPAIAALARAVRANQVGEYDTASEQSVRAHRLFRASGNVAGALRAQFEQTFAAQLKRESEGCRRQATAALAESERYSYPWLQIQLGLEKGDCFFLMGDIGTDKKTTDRAMDRAQKSGYGALYLRALSFGAEDKHFTGDESGALAIGGIGLERYWSGQFPAVRGYSLYVGLALVGEAASRPNLEVAIWRDAVALIDTDEGLLFRAMAHSLMADAATAAHLPQVAEQQYAEAARLFAAAPRTGASRNDALETEIRAAQLEAHQGRFDDAIGRLTSIQDQVRPLSNNYLVQMFYSTLGGLQLGMHREVEAEQALKPALVLAEQNLESLRSEAERISWSKDAAPVYLALSQAELAQSRPQEALEMYEWYLGASQRVATNPRAPRSLTSPPVPIPSGIALRLPLLSRETVLAFGLLPGGLAIWIYDDRGVSAQWIPKSTQDLQELAARFSDLSSDPKSELSALRRDAHSLYESLIAPVEGRLAPGRTLVVEAEGPLARVPFEALLDSNGHYLIERWPIVHSLGQDSDARLRSDTGISADLPALVVGSTASSPADGLIPLPDVAAEADTVAGGFHSARVLNGGEATLNAVRSALPAAAVFHFAGHSLSTPEKAGLMLVNGEARSDTPLVLDADALRRLKLPSMQLAVLSACSTASGSGGSGGFNSVTEALLRAGVPHVVASRWAVDSVEARAFVEDFYRNALSGQSVSDAIRLTSRKMLSNSRTSHPYYWSAFAAYGRP
jgi:CHAT domain-containing protein/tetratricopeptide (TPR) repeat protein